MRRIIPKIIAGGGRYCGCYEIMTGSVFFNTVTPKSVCAVVLQGMDPLDFTWPFSQVPKEDFVLNVEYKHQMTPFYFSIKEPDKYHFVIYELAPVDNAK